MRVLGFSGFTRDSRLPGGGRSPLAMTNQGFDTIFSFRDGEVPFSMFPLGYFGHDASAALVVDGKVVAAAAEERFTRTKHALNLAGNTLLPRHAIHFCLNTETITNDNVDIVAHYCDFRESVVKTRLDLLRSYLSPEDVKNVEESYQSVYQAMMRHDVIIDQFKQMIGARPREFMPVNHHEAHAASAFFTSGFSEALILTLDGTGELESSLIAIGRDGRINELRRTLLPTSLGALYLIITVFLGFRSLDDEYKVMGLAAYGDPCRYRNFFESLVVLESEGNYSTSLLVSKRFKELLIEKIGPPRKPNEPIEQRHADIAASLQEALNRAVLHTLQWVRALTDIRNLCLAGGVALNCSLNGAIARSGLFEDIFVQPAASDEGCSVGAALYAYHNRAGNLSSGEQIRWDHVYLGPDFSEKEIVSALQRYQNKLHWNRPHNIVPDAAKELVRGKVLGWFQGRMEFGPRALGNRSILADPRDPEMKDRINLKVKRRELFRPFAPAVLEEEADKYFDLKGLSSTPFMLFAVPVNGTQRTLIPAVTHVDGTARLQTVSRLANPLFWNLISEFKKLTGISVLLNTSFNVKNEPIVCTPADAIQGFLSTDIDCLVKGNYIVKKRVVS